MEKILLIGSGGRDHAMAEALAKDQDVNLYAAIAFRNPGILRLAESFVATESDINAVIDFARKESINYCVVGPEKPLEDGIVDKLTQAGFPCASPSQEAAKIETDKAFMRSLLKRCKIPGQIDYVETTSVEEAISFCERHNWQIVVKPVGLTAGKGVRVWGDHFNSPQEVRAYVEAILSQKISGHEKVIIEELLVGQEVTIHFFCDGNSAIPTPAIQDHKRAYDGDHGPNTGGMGSYSCADGLLPFLSREDYDQACRIGQKVVEALKSKGTPFKGVLYGQFMLTAGGVKIIEFNARFGDPEAINTLLLLRSSFSTICRKIIEGTLTPEDVRFAPLASVVRYVVPEGYGTDPRSNQQVSIGENEVKEAGSSLFFASCNLERDGQVSGEKTRISTTGSRTLAVAATAPDIFEAQRHTEEALLHIEGKVFHRKDIGTKEAIEMRVRLMEQLRRH